MFENNKFIDREFEQELFEDLLRFKSSARILAIRDSGGMGKSYLLEKFQYRCRTVKPRTAVSLIALDQLPDKYPLTVINLISKQLSAFKIKFDRFTQYENARRDSDFNTIRSSIYAEALNFTGASDVRLAGTMTNLDVGTTKNLFVTAANRLPLTSEQQEVAREVVIKCFVEDLQKYCADQPVVIMLDSYEKSETEIKSWIENFLENYFYDVANPFGKLVLVIAGREIPPFQIPKDDYEALIRSVTELRKWEKRHVEECLSAHGFDYTPEEVETFYGLIKMGIPPSEVIEMIRMALAARRGLK